MKKWPNMPLGEVAEFVNGRAFKPSEWSEHGVPIIRIQNLTNPLAPANLYDGAIDKRNAVKKGDLLVSWSATLDAFIWEREDAVLNQHIFRVVPDYTKVTKLYLFHAIRSVMDELRSQTHGATMKHITKGPFERTEIPVPPLPEQARIVKLLDEVDALRRLRAEADTRTAALIPALFDEMFGDPSINPKGLPASNFADQIELMEYGPRFYNESYSETGTRIVRITDLDAFGNLDFTAMPKLEVEADVLSKRRLDPGDLIFARTGATVGKVAVISEEAPPCIAGAYFIRMKFRSTINPEYAAQVIRHPSIQQIILNNSRQAAQQNFSGPGIRSLPLLLPPLALQKKFVARVTELRALEASQTQSRARLEELFQSMLHKAFRGEL